METTKRKRGFTLVELITVIAMLLLLIGAVTSSGCGVSIFGGGTGTTLGAGAPSSIASTVSGASRTS